MTIRLIASIFALVIIAAAVGYFVQSAEPPEFPRSVERARIASGQLVYMEHCASCHGANGEGQPGWQNATSENPLAPPHDASGHTWEHPDRAMFRFIKTGVLDDICTFPTNGGMPQFINVLSDDQIRDVVAFIVSRWPQHIKDKHEAVNREYNRQDDLLAGNN